MYMGDRKCLRPPPWFKDVFFNLKWTASLTPLSNQRSSLSPVLTPGCLQRSVHFLTGVGVLLSLVLREWHASVGPYVYGWGV